MNSRDEGKWERETPVTLTCSFLVHLHFAQTDFQKIIRPGKKITFWEREINGRIKMRCEREREDGGAAEAEKNSFNWGRARFSP